MARVVFPVPGWPAIMCIFPRASQSSQAQYKARYNAASLASCFESLKNYTS
jgi:hypothetical protein